MSESPRDVHGDYELVQQVLSGLKDAVLFIDPDGTLLYVNPTAAQLLHLPLCPPHQLKAYQLNFHQLNPGEALAQLVQKVLQTGQSQEAEQNGVGPGWLNDDAVYHVSAMPAFSGRRLQGIIVTLRDITAERRWEQAKVEFYNKIAHDMRTPLSVLISFSELLSYEIADANMDESHRQELQSFVETMRESGEEALEMVSHYLDYAKIDAGCMELHRSRTSLRPIIARVVREMAPLAHRKQQQLVTHVTTSELADLAVEVDSEQTRRALANLVSNAIKYTPEHGTVTVRLAQEGNSLVLEVEDTGIGIAPEDMQCLFARYRRCRNARQTSGLGLGLLIVKEIAEAHGGRVTVWSRPGQGSRFSIHLPLDMVNGKYEGRG